MLRNSDDIRHIRSCLFETSKPYIETMKQPISYHSIPAPRPLLLPRYYDKPRCSPDIIKNEDKQNKRKKEIIVKRLSAFKFEVVLNEELQEKPEIKIKSPETLNQEIEKKLVNKRIKKVKKEEIPVRKVSVIQRVPTLRCKEEPTRTLQERIPSPNLPLKKRITEEKPEVKEEEVCSKIQPIYDGDTFTIEDAMLRRIVEILMWVVLGDTRLQLCGYPKLQIHRVVWNAVRSCCVGDSDTIKEHFQDHDCGSNMNCFLEHVFRFLTICAPNEDIWRTLGWIKLNVDSILWKLYNEDLKPWLRYLYPNVRAEIMSADINIGEMLGWRQNHRLVRWDFTDNTFTRNFVKTVDESDQEIIDVESADEVVVVNKQVPEITFPAQDHNKKSLAAMPGSLGLHNKAPGNTGKGGEPRKRGRPAMHNGPKAKKSKRVLLWRFVFNLVEDPTTDPYIRWINRKEGIFQILNSEWLARKWGTNHGNPRMTYEKMARAMRTYYRSKILQPVPRNHQYPRKLIYRINPKYIEN